MFRSLSYTQGMESSRPAVSPLQNCGGTGPENAAQGIAHLFNSRHQHAGVEDDQHRTEEIGRVVVHRSKPQRLPTSSTKKQVSNVHTHQHSADPCAVQDLYLHEIARLKRMLLHEFTKPMEGLQFEIATPAEPPLPELPKWIRRFQKYTPAFQDEIRPSRTPYELRLGLPQLVNPKSACYSYEVGGLDISHHEPQPDCFFWNPRGGGDAACFRCQLKIAVERELRSPRFANPDVEERIPEDARRACLYHLQRSMLDEWKMIVEARSGMELPPAVYNSCKPSLFASKITAACMDADNSGRQFLIGLMAMQEPRLSTTP